MDLSATQSAGSTHAAAQPAFLEHIEKWLARPWVPIVVNLTALLLLTLSLAHWTWRLLTPVAPPPTRASAQQVGASGDYNLSVLTAAHLFGQNATPTASGALENIPLSSLNLVLSGVLLNSSGSFALISADGAPEMPFGIGQDIVSGAVLHAVYADRVIIRRGGSTESLMLKDIANLPSGSVTTAPRPSTAKSAPTPAPKGNTFSVGRDDLNKQMQKPDFLNQALMVPNAGGGFLVREIQPGSLYEKLGLRVGDVIRTVNGQAVNTIDDVMKIYQQMGAGGSGANQINLEIRRAGKTETLNYNLQ